jgi:hypothetical protein
MDWYFTFGQTHTTITGYLMRDHYVKVKGGTMGQAKEAFINRFMSKNMKDNYDFHNQYTEEEFNERKDFFPKGEYKVIKLN